MPGMLRFLHSFARIADTIIDAIGRTVAWLVLFVILALFAQWPLRELVGGGHILANDFGQIAHAAVFSIGIAYALRWDGHVRLDLFYQRMSTRGRAWVDLVGTLCIVMPWAGIVLWFGWQTTLRSVAVFEKFPDTWSPGYWLFKVLLIVFAVLLLLQAAGHIARDIAQLLERAGAAPTPEPRQR
jgi:TRAP-type mannitol/chloroaromatic compound transport system permease small subunit